MSQTVSGNFQIVGNGQSDNTRICVAGSVGTLYFSINSVEEGNFGLVIQYGSTDLDFSTIKSNVLLNNNNQFQIQTASGGYGNIFVILYRPNFVYNRKYFVSYTIIASIIPNVDKGILGQFSSVNQDIYVDPINNYIQISNEEEYIT